MHTVWVKKSPHKFSDIFFQNGWEFLVQILEPIKRSYLRRTTNFYSIPTTLMKLCHIKRDHHNVLKMSTIDWNARWVVALNMA